VKRGRSTNGERPQVAKQPHTNPLYIIEIIFVEIIVAKLYFDLIKYYFATFNAVWKQVIYLFFALLFVFQ
jgi:hypothetical protein